MAVPKDLIKKPQKNTWSRGGGTQMFGSELQQGCRAAGLGKKKNTKRPFIKKKGGELRARRKSKREGAYGPEKALQKFREVKKVTGLKRKGEFWKSPDMYPRKRGCQ